jgi:hypothetical protein
VNFPAEATEIIHDFGADQAGGTCDEKAQPSERVGGLGS